MKLNRLQTVFFDEILNAELDVPVHATLKYEGATFDIIVVPEIDPAGYFKLKYYNAPSYDPEVEDGDDGISYRTFTMEEALGSHPLLERAWQERAAIELELWTAQLPIQSKPKRTLKTRVLYAAVRNKGVLVLYDIQVVLKGSPLRKAKFSISDFCDFVTPRSGIGSIASISLADRQILQNIGDKLGDAAELTIRASPSSLVLNTGDGWKITLTKDENGTNDGITHTGVVEKSDGGDFGCDELSNVLDGLRYFFAFTMASYCLPSVTIGYDANQRVTWGEAGKFIPNRQRPMNWFQHAGEVPSGGILERFFPAFWAKWTTNKDEVSAVIDCYVKSTVMRRAGLPQDAVAKNCFGLEILASLILGKTIHPPDAAAEEIDKVLRCYRIPNRHISGSDTPVLNRLHKNLRSSNDLGANIIVTVRNYVAHPLHKKRTEIRPQYLEYLDSDVVQYVYLHDLSQFYLEYVFLRSCGFNIGSHRTLLETQR